MADLTPVEAAVLDALTKLGDRWTSAFAVAPVAMVSSSGCVWACRALRDLGLVEVDTIGHYRITDAGKEAAHG